MKNDKYKNNRYLIGGRDNKKLSLVTYMMLLAITLLLFTPIVCLLYLTQKFNLFAFILLLVTILVHDFIIVYVIGYRIDIGISGDSGGNDDKD